MEGSIFPTFILFICSILSPIANINSPPTADISVTTESIRNCFINEAVIVIKPWYRKTDTEENNTPIPMEDVKAMAEIPSITDFA